MCLIKKFISPEGKTINQLLENSKFLFKKKMNYDVFVRNMKQVGEMLKDYSEEHKLFLQKEFESLKAEEEMYWGYNTRDSSMC